MSAPNVCEMMHAIRGQPNRGVRDLQPRPRARMSALPGPFGPGFLPQAGNERLVGQIVTKLEPADELALRW